VPEVLLSRVMTWHFFRNSARSGKPHLYSRRCAVLISSLASHFRLEPLLCFPEISLLFVPPARLRWRRNGRGKVPSRRSSRPSTPTTNCHLRVTICPLSQNLTFFTLSMLESYFRKSSALGGFVVGSLFRQRIPTNLSFTFPFLFAALLFPFLPSSAASLISMN
jgi:hypothetical protein